jgi:hypothetical protein
MIAPPSKALAGADRRVAREFAFSGFDRGGIRAMNSRAGGETLPITLISIVEYSSGSTFRRLI